MSILHTIERYRQVGFEVPRDPEKIEELAGGLVVMSGLAALGFLQKNIRYVALGVGLFAAYEIATRIRARGRAAASERACGAGAP